jgi:hypothetical protein
LQSREITRYIDMVNSHQNLAPFPVLLTDLWRQILVAFFLSEISHFRDIKVSPRSESSALLVPLSVARETKVTLPLVLLVVISDYHRGIHITLQCNRNSERDIRQSSPVSGLLYRQAVHFFHLPDDLQFHSHQHCTNRKRLLYSYGN